VRFDQLPSLYRPSDAGVLIFAIASAVLFFGSLLLHELGHAGVARSRRIGVDGITLWMFGGATQTRSDAKGPVDEFLIAAVGPATNFVLGALLLWIGHALPSGASRVLLLDLGSLNILLAEFNVLPGFPMDGGRMLRSIVWGVTRNRSLATMVAARVGQVFGIGVAAYGVFKVTQSQDLSSLWLTLIGVILFQAATATVAEERRARALGMLVARDAMRTPPTAVAPETPVGTVRDAILAGREGAFPVMAGPNLLGFVSRSMLEGMSPDRPVGEAAAGVEAAAVVPVSAPLGDVVARMRATTGGLALVVDGDRLVGVIGQDDLTAALSRGSRV
jgi:Zn-dependent protease